MSDISIKFSGFDWVVIAVLLGWPGLLVGAAAGAFLWKRRRIWGGVLGGLAGCLAVFGARILTM